MARLASRRGNACMETPFERSSWFRVAWLTLRRASPRCYCGLRPEYRYMRTPPRNLASPYSIMLSHDGRSEVLCSPAGHDGLHPRLADAMVAISGRRSSSGRRTGLCYAQRKHFAPSPPSIAAGDVVFAVASQGRHRRVRANNGKHEMWVNANMNFHGSQFLLLETAFP